MEATLPTAKREKSLLAELAEVVILAAIIFAVVTFALQTVLVEGFSMVPTLQDQDRLISTKFDYHLHHPLDGDIVILKSPTDDTQDYIKRVIAGPGDQLRIVSGRVWVNGRLLHETYLRTDESFTYSWPPDNPDAGVVLGPDNYFVMGDNRNHSLDSRVFGFVKAEDIQARAWIRIWPLNHFGAISTPPSL